MKVTLTNTLTDLSWSDIYNQNQNQNHDSHNQHVNNEIHSFTRNGTTFYQQPGLELKQEDYNQDLPQYFNSNSVNLNINVGKYLIESCSNILLNYAGIIHLNLSKNNDLIRKQYHNNLKPLNIGIWNLADLPRINFNGIDTFEARIRG
eukprot:4822_1